MKGTEATEPPLQGILKLRWQKSSQMGRLSSPQIAEIKNNKIWLYKNWKRNLSEFARGGVRARNGLFIRLIIRYPNTFLNHSMIKTSSSLFLRSENKKILFWKVPCTEKYINCHLPARSVAYLGRMPTFMTLHKAVLTRGQIWTQL